MLFIWWLSCFLNYAYIAVNFPLSTVFSKSHRLLIVMFSLSLTSRYFKFFSLIFFSDILVIKMCIYYHPCICLFYIVLPPVKVLVLVVHLCPTLCDSMACSPWVSSVCGILWARILEWVVIPFSRGSSQPRDRIQVSHIAEDSLPSELPGKTLHFHL